MTFDEFLNHCTACGGNWTAMLMTGIKEVAPQVYEKLPDRKFDFSELCFIVNHLCHDRPHPRYCLAFLAEKGYITVSGRINRKYFSERLYGIEQED